MNNKKTSKFAIRRAKETKLGRFLCRLAGEENGQAMMEYVVIAVGIAAVVALGAFFFGSTILDLFGIASKSVSGNPKAGAQEAEVLMDTTVKERVEAAAENGDKFNTEDPKRPEGPTVTPEV